MELNKADRSRLKLDWGGGSSRDSESCSNESRGVHVVSVGGW